MNIKDFLIDNYIWILIVILLIIVTIIGFLADKKKNDSKKQVVPMPNNNNNNLVQNNNQIPMQYQPQMNQTDNNMMNYNQPPVNNNLNQQNMSSGFNQSMNTELNQIPPVAPNMNVQNNPQPVENIVPPVHQEPMYQPLSEQKPVFAPQPIPNFNQMQAPINEMNVAMNNDISNQNSIPSQLVMPSMNQPMPSQTPENLMPNFNNIHPQPLQFENQNQNMVPNMMPNMNNNMPQDMGTIPTPINITPIEMPSQPVIAQPQTQNNYQTPDMMNQNYNQPTMMPQNNDGNQMVQNLPSQPVNNPSPSQGVNFVYGPQNNNQNM